MSIQAKLTSLHRAVIEDDDEAIARLCKEVSAKESKDYHGYTPLEIAQFLGKRSAQELLGGIFPQFIMVQRKGELSPQLMPLIAFEKEFNLVYRPFLTFSSYEMLTEVIRHCPMVFLWPTSDNNKLVRAYLDFVLKGTVAPIYVKWIDDQVGYGAFAAEDLPAEMFVGEYAGEVRRLDPLLKDLNPYCYQYPTGLWQLDQIGLPVANTIEFFIDPMREGNLLRFANHSDRPNLQIGRFCDRKLLHLIFLTSHAIPKDTQLTFDYGEFYWNHNQGKIEI